MDTQRQQELDSVLKDSDFRYSWCAAGPCACSGCVNGSEYHKFIAAGIIPPTKEEWYEWTFHALLEDIAITQDHIDRLLELKKRPPTVSNYREWLSVADKASKHEQRIRRALR